MAQSFKIADEEMEVVRKESALQSRSIAGQIVHWLRIGRAIERSPKFDYARIRAALEAELSPDELTGDEQEVWIAELGTEMTTPPSDEKAFFSRRRRKGQGVGMDEDGKLIYQTPQK